MHADQIYYTKDRGATWATSKGFTSLPDHCIHNLAADKVEPNTFYLYTRGTAGGFFKSTDGGATFTRMSISLPNSIWEPQVVTLPGKQGHIVFGGNGSGLSYSTEGGANFKGIAGVSKVVVLATGKEKPGSLWPSVYFWGDYAGQTGLFRSTDGLVTWEKVTTEIPLDIHSRPVCMDADKDKYGVVYLGLNGKGFAFWGPPAATAIRLAVPHNQPGMRLNTTAAAFFTLDGRTARPSTLNSNSIFKSPGMYIYRTHQETSSNIGIDR
jgi:hypothetical protein